MVNIDAMKPVRPDVHVTVFPEVFWMARRHALCPSTNGISPPSQQHSVRIPCPLGPGLAGRISQGVHGSHEIWERATETAPTLQYKPILLDMYLFAGIYFAIVLLILFLSRLLVWSERILRQALEQTRSDPDAPWQASWETLEDDAPSTLRADSPTRWEEDTLTLCGEDDAPGQAGMDIEGGDEWESDDDRLDWHPSPPSSTSGEFLEERGRREQRSPPHPLDWA